MTWNPLDEPMDKIWLAQRWSPGLCDISGANSPREYEERKGYGLSGAIVIFRGVGLAHFSVRFRLYTTQDWDEWEQFKPLVDKPPLGRRPRALDIWHPLLVDQGIYAVAIEDLGQPDQTEDGVWTIEIKCVEYRFPKYSLSQPDGAAATPVDPYEQQIEQLTKQAVDLMAAP